MASNKKHRILGFDPASFRNLGWSLIEAEKKNFQCMAGTFVIPKTKEKWQALWPIFLTVDALLTKEQPSLVVIEETSPFAGGFVTGQVSKCMGVILACCGSHGLNVSLIHPTHVKKIITGNGRAKKAEMKHSIKNILKTMGITGDFDSEHAIDATGNILCWMADNGVLEITQDE